MNDVALRTTGHGAWRRFADGCRQVLLAMAEGFAAARRYQRLAMLSDAELRQSRRHAPRPGLVRGVRQAPALSARSERARGEVALTSRGDA